MIMEMPREARKELKKRVLKYFDVPNGRRVDGMTNNWLFKGYDKGAVMQMVHALHRETSLEMVSGTTRDAAYRTVRDED